MNVPVVFANALLWKFPWLYRRSVTHPKTRGPHAQMTLEVCNLCNHADEKVSPHTVYESVVVREMCDLRVAKKDIDVSTVVAAENADDVSKTANICFTSVFCNFPCRWQQKRKMCRRCFDLPVGGHCFYYLPGSFARASFGLHFGCGVGGLLVWTPPNVLIWKPLTMGSYRQCPARLVQGPVG